MKNTKRRYKSNKGQKKGKKNNGKNILDRRSNLFLKIKRYLTNLCASQCDSRFEISNGNIRL